MTTNHPIWEGCSTQDCKFCALLKNLSEVSQVADDYGCHAPEEECSGCGAGPNVPCDPECHWNEHKENTMSDNETKTDDSAELDKKDDTGSTETPEDSYDDLFDDEEDDEDELDEDDEDESEDGGEEDDDDDDE